METALASHTTGLIQGRSCTGHSGVINKTEALHSTSNAKSCGIGVVAGKAVEAHELVESRTNTRGCDVRLGRLAQRLSLASLAKTRDHVLIITALAGLARQLTADASTNKVICLTKSLRHARYTNTKVRIILVVAHCAGIFVDVDASGR
jgi:hypothetical protein